MALFPVVLDKLYENMDEASVGKWLVKPGQKVRCGDVVGEVVSDKMNAEVEAPGDAYVAKILIPENKTVPFGTTLILLTTEQNEDYNDQKFSEKNMELLKKSEAILGHIPDFPKGTGEAKPAEITSFKAAPAAKMYARKLNVDLQSVADFVKRTTIHKQDVQIYWESVHNGAKSSPCCGAFCFHSEPLEKASKPDAKRCTNAAQTKRVALITGASGGIGSAIAEQLACCGCNLILQYFKQTNKMTAFAKKLQDSYSTKIKILEANFLDEDSVDVFIKQAMDAFGTVDILINAAGMLADAPIPFMSNQQWNDVLFLNLTVPFQLMRGFVMPMGRKKWGRVVSISSDAGKMGSANRANYAAAKAGLLGLTRSAAREFANFGVTVNAISPGFVNTDMTSAIPPKRKQALEKEIPIHRFGDAKEVASLVKYLVSEPAAYITGQAFNIDGGLLME
ncbi:MAG: 3-oxoacyl-ACP reductase FabG [Lentisphaeria bacterium]